MTMPVQPIKRALDRGFVRLVDSMGGDVSIVRAARVSYNAAWRSGQDTASDTRLIHYLYQNKHLTPFEAVTLTFEVYAPIFVFRQWHRHRTQSYNELSGRYRELNPEWYMPRVDDIGVQSTVSKQARDLVELTPEERQEQEGLIREYELHCAAGFSLYRRLLEKGWPRELARLPLPFSTYSHMFTTMNLRNLMHFLDLRTHSHAQYEIRVYANAMVELASLVAPVAMEAWRDHHGGQG